MLILGLVIGAVLGVMLGAWVWARLTPRMLGSLTQKELKALADRVAKVRGDDVE